MYTGENDSYFELCIDRISWHLADLNIPFERVSSRRRQSDTEQIAEFVIRELSKNIYSRLVFTISLLGDHDPGERIWLNVEYYETQWPTAKRVNESFYVLLNSKDGTDAFDRCLEEASNKFMVPLLNRSDFTAEELGHLVKRLVLPEGWTARVWDTGFSDLIEIVHRNTEQVIARYRFYRRKMYPSRMSLFVGYDPLHLQHWPARYLAYGLSSYGLSNDSKINDHDRIFFIWRDYILEDLFRSLGDFCDSSKELEDWGRLIQQLLRTGAPGVSWFERLMMPEITAYPRIDKDNLGRWLQGYRSGKFWEESGRIGLRQFMGEPLDDDLGYDPDDAYDDDLS